MILRHFRSLPRLRLLAVPVAAAAVMMLLAADGRDTRPAGADPAFGNLRPYPPAGVVIEGHYFTLSSTMTTCADNATPHQGLATAGTALTLTDTTTTSGTLTAATSTVLTDSSKAWVVNSLAGMQLNINSGPQSGQFRTIASNTATVITLATALPGAPAIGNSYSAARNWTANQYAGYDVMLITGTGSPQTRTVASNTTNALTLASSWGGVVDTGTASAGTTGSVADPGTNAEGPHTTSTLKDVGEAWTVNQWVGKALELTGGTGISQVRIIVANTADTLTISPNWTVTPDATTDYEIENPTTVTDTGSNWLGNEWLNKTVEFPTLDPAQTRTIINNGIDTLTVHPAWTTLVAQNAAGGGTSTTLTDSGFTADALVNKTVQIISGPASGQSRRIASNTATALTIDGTWTTSTGGTLTGVPTTVTLEDVSKTWTPGAFVGMTLEMLTGAQINNPRLITANTATTITINALPGAPAFGDAYRVLQVPTASSQYVVREGPAIGTAFNIKDNSLPVAGTGYQLFKSACRPGGFNVTMGYDDVFGQTGTADSPFTTTTLKDTGKTWAVNEWAGKPVVLTGGTGSGQKRTIVSNTVDTLTINALVPWTTTPDATTTYEIPLARFDVATDSGITTSTTSTTLVDTSQAWKINQWAGSRIKIILGAGVGQTRVIVSNTATQLVVSPAWSVPMPGPSSLYQVGGIQDGGWLESTGRTLSCPFAPVYGAGTAALSCVTLGTPPNGLPQGPTGTGPMVTLVLKAGAHSADLGTFTSSGQILEVDSTTIPADMLGATRRVILCPDSAPFVPGPDGNLNIADVAAMAQANGAKGPPAQAVPDPLYTPQKDPTEDGVSNVADRGALANVYGKKCIQP